MAFTQQVLHGVVSGCDLTVSTTALTTQVASGTIRHTGRVVPVAAQTVTHAPADSAQDRWDLISADSAGTVTATSGALGTLSAGTLVQPTTSDVVLGNVAITAGMTAPAHSEDTRTFIPQTFSQYRKTGDWYIPVGAWGGGLSFDSSFNQRMWLQPIWFEADTPIQSLAVGIAGGTANSTAVARLGAYTDNGSLGLSLLVDGGTVSVSAATASPGVRSVAVTATLNAGWSWLACALQTLSATAHLESITLSSGPIGVTTSSSALIGAGTSGMYVTGVSGALPDPPGVLNRWIGAMPLITVQLA